MTISKASSDSVVTNSSENVLNTLDSTERHTIASLEASTSGAVVVNQRPLLSRDGDIFALYSGAALARRPETSDCAQYLRLSPAQLRADTFCSFKNGLGLV